MKNPNPPNFSDIQVFAGNKLIGTINGIKEQPSKIEFRNGSVIKGTDDNPSTNIRGNSAKWMFLDDQDDEEEEQ